ncbi:MAG: hypothetical protein WED09_10490 [Homoserinimonas sp.]
MSNPGDTTPYGASQTIYQQVVRPPSNGMATAALVLGIIAIAFGVWSVIPILGLFAAFTAFVPAVLAVVFGAIGRTRSTTLAGIGRGQALTGLVLGAVTLTIIVLTTIGWALLSIPFSVSESYVTSAGSLSGLGA